MKLRFAQLCILISIMTFLSPLHAQHMPGRAFIFQSFSDVGEPDLPGSYSYEAQRQEYRLKGAGENIWFGKDQFSYLWKIMEGDFILQAELEFIGEGVNPHRKAGLMFRKKLDAGSPHVSCTIHGDGLTSLQYRDEEGADMDELGFDISGPAVIQLERKGRKYTMSVAHRGHSYTSQSLDLDLSGPLHAGLFICSHESDVVEEARFSNVRIFNTAPDTLVPYRDYLGSLLEIMDVRSGLRTALNSSTTNREAPNWTTDGKYLIYNAYGLLYQHDIEQNKTNLLNTGFADRNNNDHVISFDGSRLAISHHAEEDGGQSVIYTLPIEGGEPGRVTPKSPSYLHGWSPDGKYLVYTAGRNGAYNIYRIPVEGGEELQLTHEQTLDDGPEYSPDGKYIYFNSARTGTMQLWRMKSDGSEATQLTFDAYNDWFPHISPDGKKLVFLSYPPEVDASDHPYYKRVCLRMIYLDGQEQSGLPMDHPEISPNQPRVIAYLYGGQGTINVPSWSPDSKRIAFISHGN